MQERITQADLPADAKPALGPLSSVIGEVFRYTLESTTVPLVELKAIQNWVLEREFRKIPGVADVVSWGGGTKQYQVNVDPSRLRGYNLTLKQVFDAVAANNSNAGGSYVPQGQYALTVRGIGLFRGPRDIENVVVAAQKGTPVRVRDIGPDYISRAHVQQHANLAKVLAHRVVRRDQAQGQEVRGVRPAGTQHEGVAG